MKSRPLIIGLFILIAVLVGSGWLLTRDETLQWAVHKAEARWPDRLSLENVRGSLLSRITADRVAWRDASREIVAEHVDFKWSPLWLLAGTIAFDKMRAGALTVASTDYTLPESLGLPLRLRFDDALVDKLTVVGSDGIERPYEHVAFSLAAGPRVWKGKLEALPTRWGTWRVSGQFGTANPFPLEATFELDPENRAPGLPAISVKGSADGNMSLIALKGEAKAQTSVAKATLQVEPTAPIPVRAIDADWNGVDARHILADAPATAVDGTLHAAKDAQGVLRGTLSIDNRSAGTLDQDRLPVVALRSAVVAGPQRWALEETVLDLGPAGQLAGEGWIEADQAGLTLRTQRLDVSGIHASLRPTQLAGSVETSGSFTQQEVRADLAEPRRAVNLEAVVDPTIVTVKRARISAGAARIDANGTVEIDEPHAFKVTAAVNGFDPSQFGQYRKAKLNGKVRATGELAPVVRVQADGTLSPSTLFGLPASGHGRIVSTGVDRVAIDMNATATIGRTNISARGTVVDPENPHAMNLAVKLKGQDLAELYTITGLSLPSTPPYDLDGQLALKDRVWSMRGFKGQVGRSDLAGDFSVDLNGERPFMRADVASQRLDMRDLGGFIGVDYSALPPPTKRLLPQSQLHREKLNSVDADVHLTGRSIRNETLPLHRMDARLQIHGGQVQLDPLNFRAAGGDIDAKITMDARRSPMITVADVQGRGLQLNRLAPTVKALLESAGTLDARTELTMQGDSTAAMFGSANGKLAVAMNGGTISDLALRLADLDVANALLALARGDRAIPIRCFVGDFAAVDGVLQPQTLVLDTEHTIVRGEGTINLRDERLALQLTAKPKDGSLLALRGPIRVDGTLASPVVHPDLGNALVRGGVAVALASVAPPALLLPLIQLGKKEQVDCEPLVLDAARFIHGTNIASAQGGTSGQRQKTASRNDEARR